MPYAVEMSLVGLVERFTVALPDEEIVWNMNHIAAPTLKGKEKEPPQMPLKISLAL